MSEIRLLSLSVPSPHDALDSTIVEIVDEGGGEFVVVKQTTGELRIDPGEWPTIRKAINRLIKECR
jgi:hypothetical protein